MWGQLLPSRLKWIRPYDSGGCGGNNVGGVNDNSDDIDKGGMIVCEECVLFYWF